MLAGSWDVGPRHAHRPAHAAGTGRGAGAVAVGVDVHIEAGFEFSHQKLTSFFFEEKAN